LRLDVYLTEKGLVKSRERAKELIKAGQVTVDGKAASKPSFETHNGCDIKIIGEQLRYAGRGGLKLEKALTAFGISLAERVCLDIGASTGGFTDCMLQSGAAFVYAVDVGHGQLNEKLREDKRVADMEKTNILELSAGDFPKKPTFISADVSFVSLKKILPKIAELMTEDSEAAVLIKPQFEAGRANIGKKGIVRDRKVHAAVLADITAFCHTVGLCAEDIVNSPITGGDGNIEYLAHIKNGGDERVFDFKRIVETAFEELNGGRV